VIAFIASGVVFIVGAIGLGLIYTVSAGDVEVSEAIEAAVLTIHDAAEWFDLDVKPELEEWDTDYYFDQSAHVAYYYNDEEESLYLNCNLIYEPKRSDALVAYGIEWGGLRLYNRIGPGDPILLEEQSDLFRWGDASRFAFQLHEGERYGMAFVARKGGKVFFLDCWGLVLEEASEIAAFIGPRLEALDRAEFLRMKETEEVP